MKKLLIITYYWPPSGGAGVQRTLKFAKYLPEFGIEPIVLTVDPDSATYPAIDASLLKEAEGIKVQRTKSFEPLKVLASIAGKKSVPHSGFANIKKETFFQKSLRFIRGNFFIPDARIGWNKFAYEKAVEIIEKEKVESVMISTPPHSSQLIGIRLKRKFPHLKWIADLRDPWTDIYYYPMLMHTAIAARKDKLLEKKVLETANEIVVVSEPIKQLFQSKIKDSGRDAIHVIPNGFDESDFNLESKIDKDCFTITYVGTITEDYKPDSFFNAFFSLLSKTNSKIKLRFVGTLPGTIAERVNEIELLFPGSIEFISYVDHLAAVRYMKEADLLLLVIPEVKNNEGILTGKLFEYLGSGKHIIGLGPKHGAAARVLEECRAGAMFERGEVLEMESYISSLVNSVSNIKKEVIIPDDSRRMKYSRRNLTKELTKLI